MELLRKIWQNNTKVSEPGFPQFNWLPWELRHAIWEQFALPRGPVVHSIRHYWTHGPSLALGSWTSEAPAIDFDMLPTIRALMQTSREAREAVLAGRQLQRLDDGIRLLCGSKFYPMAPNYFFVNWEIDLFYFGRTLPLGLFYTGQGSWVSKIKRLAVALQDTLDNRHVVVVSCFDDFLWFSLMEHLPDLLSLKNVYLVFENGPARRLYQHARLPPSQNGDEFDQNETVTIEEDPETYSDGESSWEPPRPYDEWDDDDWDFTCWMDELPTDLWGFHNVGPESDLHARRSRKLTCIVTKIPNDKTRMPFLDWLNSMVSGTKEEAEKITKQNVDVEMVLDIDDICRFR
ncbi:hypothetical protein F5Y14DRAFT_451920 [Nemania sp. NC0429]|nr:hypothetical protein F5Y14DRAFT_451920 [Nemania sp. NC0429]